MVQEFLDFREHCTAVASTKACSPVELVLSTRLRRVEFANEMDELRGRLMYASRLFG